MLRMINSQMDNPFMIGDLVHIPKGIVFYVENVNYTSAFPAFVNDKPCVGLIMRKTETGFYNISIGENEYLVKKEDISLITRKDVK